MKRLLIAAILAMTACNQPGSKGNEGANGGGQVAQQAATIVSEVVSTVENSPQDFPEVRIDALKAAAQRLRLIVREQTFVDGVETDAKNNGYDLIELNGARWPGLIDHDRRLALIFHELLGLIGLEKDSYAISSRLLTPENRFQSEQTYTCQVDSGLESSCQLTTRFDRTQKALIVRTKSGSACPGFESSFTFFYKHSRRHFALDRPCVDPDSPPPTVPIPCQSTMGPQDRYSSMTFLDGGRFFFEGLFRDSDTRGPGVQKRLMCPAL